MGSGSKDDNEELDGNVSNDSVESGHEICEAFAKHYSVARRSTLIKRYFGCGPISAWADYPCDEMPEESCADERKDGSLALVPYQAPDASSVPKSSVNREAHGKPGWPLVRRVFLPKHHESDNKALSRKTSMVRRVFKIPGRHSSMAVHPDRKRRESAQMDEHLSDLIAESGAIVPVDVPSSPFGGMKYLTKELEGFHEKYSSTCRLFAYQELLSATSNFSPGLFNIPFFKFCCCLNHDGSVLLNFLQSNFSLCRENDRKRG